ncbi:lipoprotein releasing system, transmembrane protein, LolC/E family [Nitrosococcus halophilus Nc 4]|uniref:Lipoprotein releasing system, transmembrane protein, LolC/E family n=1 Tax=Nitrosococcus halophilus (strain Nc4) TaxID=472759 RepID=D5BW67_NITHN|nr:lipoprotein-releasing ABC transporter permease subunit [Nitrosococcus halophilus]ADE13717.1 lipoprotein releasing system, transmembrane protein, LolC/E family [Nitrosococcus halophilus Nc 4]
MFKPLPFYIGLRYTRAKRRSHFISFISLTSMLGVSLGVAALITVLSVMNGFEKELRTRILGMVSHVIVTGPDGTLGNWQALKAQLEKDSRLVGIAPFVEGQGMLTHRSQVRGTLVRGILPQQEDQVADIRSKMVVGSLDVLHPGSFQIVLGMDLARALGVFVGDKITLVTPHATTTPAGVIPRLKRLTVAGVFQVGMYEYDSALAVMNLEDAALLFRIPGKISGLRLKLDNLFKAPYVARELRETLPGSYRTADWTYQHANFFRALKTEKTVMFVILFLIVAVAAFNIVSTLVMVVTDKQADIAILRTLGATPASIMGIFMVQGTAIGFIGTLLGMIGGIALAFNVETVVPQIEALFGVQFLPADVYYISDLPSELSWHDVITVCSTAFLLCVLVTLYPAWRAARTQPAEALRYE